MKLQNRNVNGRYSVVFGLLLVIALMTTGCASQRASAERQRGLVAMGDGQYELAETHFAKAAEYSGTDWRSRHYLGRVYLKLDRPLDAQLQLEKAYALRAAHPETGNIIDDLASALYRQKSEEALLDLLDGATQNYGTPRDFLRKGDYLARLGHIDAARVSYQKAVRFGKAGDPQPYLAYAKFNQQIGDAATEIEALRHALYLSPNNKEVRERLRHHGLIPGPTLAVKPAEYDLVEVAEPVEEAAAEK